MGGHLLDGGKMQPMSMERMASAVHARPTSATLETNLRPVNVAKNTITRQQEPYTRRLLFTKGDHQSNSPGTAPSYADGALDVRLVTALLNA